MARLNQIAPETATGRTKDLLDAVKGKLGLVPNMTRAMANAPAVLEGYLELSGALGKGTLPARTREQLALAIGQANGCDYCVSAHSAIGKMVGLTADQIRDSRLGTAVDSKNETLIRFARKVLETAGTGHRRRHPGGPRRRIRRRRHRRGGGACGAQRVHQLLQQRGRDRHRLPQGRGPAAGRRMRRYSMTSPLISSPSTVIAPPFTLESAIRKVRAAEDAWNSRDPERVAPGVHRGLGLAEPDRVPGRPRSDPPVPGGEVGARARLPAGQGAVGVHRRPDRGEVRVRVPRPRRQLVPQLRQRAVGVRRTRADAPPGSEH